ncbi:MAG TPA: hypothetical protein VMW38_27385 [Terriglobia bacterium]|nr:hypothetical protein [Terriglobia bacterium]
MRIEKDFKDFVSLFNKYKVQYIVVGAYAVGYHGIPRATQDIDLYVRPNQRNAVRIARALEEFGFTGLDQRDLIEPGKVIMLGRPPMRIDLLTRISGVTWEAAWRNRESGDYGGQNIPIIGLKELIANKRAAGRAKDLADLEALTKRPSRRIGKPKTKDSDREQYH